MHVKRNITEGIASVKSQLIKAGSNVVYDGNPADYKWRPSRAKTWFEHLSKILQRYKRQFDQLIITGDSTYRNFLAISHGSPEIVYHYKYDQFGYTTNVYSEAVQLAAVSKYGLAIYYIQRPSEVVQINAVLNDSSAIRFIQNPSERVQINAVLNDSSAIQFIQNPSEQIQLAAVQQKGLAIQYIKNPTEAVQLAAVKKEGYAIKHIKNPSEAVQLAAIKNSYGMAIQFIKNPSEAVQLAAVSDRAWSIRYINNPSEAVQLEAIKKNPGVIEMIDQPSKNIIITCVLKFMILNQNRAVHYYKQYKNLYPDWPEWGPIERSLRASKLI